MRLNQTENKNDGYPLGPKTTKTIALKLCTKIKYQDHRQTDLDRHLYFSTSCL